MSFYELGDVGFLTDLHSTFDFDLMREADGARVRVRASADTADVSIGRHEVTALAKTGEYLVPLFRAPLKAQRCGDLLEIDPAESPNWSASDTGPRTVFKTTRDAWADAD